MTRTFIAIAAALAAFPASAQVYKCVESGHTVYSQIPCAAGAASTTIRRDAPSGPAPGSGAASGQSAAEQEQAFRKRQQQQAEAAKKDGAKQQEAQERQQNCTTARSQLANYEVGGRISRINANGEREFLDDAGIEQEKARVRALVQEWCK